MVYIENLNRRTIIELYYQSQILRHVHVKTMYDKIGFAWAFLVYKGFTKAVSPSRIFLGHFVSNLKVNFPLQFSHLIIQVVS